MLSRISHLPTAAAVLLFGLAVNAGTLMAQPAQPAPRAEPRYLPQAVGESTEKALPVPSPELRQALGAGEGLRLRSAQEGAGDQLDAMAAWNSRGKRPTQIGFARRLPAVIELRQELLAPAPAADASGAAAAASGVAGSPATGVSVRSRTGTWVWGAKVKVPGAFRLRLHLEKVNLPATTRLWVWGGEGPARSFGLELVSPQRELWTPSVAGETIALAVELPASAGSGPVQAGPLMRVTAAAQVFPFGAPELGLSPQSTSCLIDATCVKPDQLATIGQLRTAVAHIEFVKGDLTYLCTGDLINQTDPDAVVPYLLTANHCISDQPIASSLEAFWDYHTTRCNGAAPDLSLLPTSSGSTLQATSLDSDFTLLKLNSIPAGRTLLGWRADGVVSGTDLFRVSHPVTSIEIFPQTYSTSVSTLSPKGGACPRDGEGRPLNDLSKFLYSTGTIGGTAPGSSGSAVIVRGGYLVGHLYGLCGTDLTNGCDKNANYQVDGAFSAAFASLAPFLAPQSTGPCVPDAATLCIDDRSGDRRFRVQSTFNTVGGGGRAGGGSPIGLSGLGVTHGGLFWFFGSDNPEILIKVLNACAVNQKFWVFFSATTNVGFTVMVTDTQTGHLVTFSNPDQNPAAPVQDTGALPCT
jgi:hypothetical protein